MVLGRSQFYEAETVKLAELSMLRHIVVSGDTARHLMEAIAGCSRQDAAHIFTGFVRLWLECAYFTMRGETPELPYMEESQDPQVRKGTSRIPDLPVEGKLGFGAFEKNRLLRKISNVDEALYNVLEFVLRACQCSVDVHLGMLDAGVLGLILAAFTNAEYYPSALIAAKKGDHLDSARQERETVDVGRSLPMAIPLDVIHAETSQLALLMGNPAFRQCWRDDQFSDRLRLCSTLLDALLDDRGEMDDDWVSTRDVLGGLLEAIK